MDSRLDDIQRLVEDARKKGAKGVEILREASQGVVIRGQRGRVAEEAAPTEDRLAVRCWLEGGREGRAEGTLEDAPAVIDQALSTAADAPEDPFAGPMGRLTPPVGGLGVDDRRYKGVERADRVEVLTTAEKAVRQVDRRLQAHDFYYTDRRRVRAFANSKGVALEEWDTLYEAGGQVRASAEGRPVELEGTIHSRTFASIASLPFGTLLARRASAVLKKGERLDGEVLVMMPPLAVARLFEALAEAFTFRAFDEDRFFLQPREDGEPVVDPRIHLVDDGSLPGGHRTTSFDDRGVAPVPLTLLREGRPEGRFLDARTAREVGARPTGHELGGRLRPSNLLLRAGTRSMNAIFTDRDTWIFLLDDLPDLSGLDLQTGELVATVHGEVMKSNEPMGGLTNATLRGNLKAVLNALEDLASNTDRHGNVDAPGMLVGGFVLEP